MDNMVYFKCPNCSKVNKVELNGDYMAVCDNCTDKNEYGLSEGISIHKFKLKDLLKLLDRLNIEWGYDEIVWINEDSNQAVVLLNGGFLTYSIDRCFNGYYVNLHDSDYNLLERFDGFFETLNEAKQACEADFKKRKKALNATG